MILSFAAILETNLRANCLATGDLLFDNAIDLERGHSCWEGWPLPTCISEAFLTSPSDLQVYIAVVDLRAVCANCRK
jgi:hypothetical protein